MEDPAVARVEALLSAMSPARTLSWLLEDPVVLSHAVSICACVTTDDAPVWLVGLTEDDDLVWIRVPDAVETRSLVKARRLGFGHAEPTRVLAWLRGEETWPWGPGEGGLTRQTADAIARRVSTAP